MAFFLLELDDKYHAIFANIALNREHLTSYEFVLYFLQKVKVSSFSYLKKSAQKKGEDELSFLPSPLPV